MALRFRQVPPNLVDTLEIGAGILVMSSAETVNEVLEGEQDRDGYMLLGATDGGVTFKATPKITSFSWDGSSRPEWRQSRLDGWTAKMSGTLKTIEEEAYDLLTEMPGAITDGFMVRENEAYAYFLTRDIWDSGYEEEEEEPEEDEEEDEEEKEEEPEEDEEEDEEEEEEEPLNSLWWIGDYGQSGGYLAIRLRNAYSSGGFQLSTRDGSSMTKLPLKVTSQLSTRFNSFMFFGQLSISSPKSVKVGVASNVTPPVVLPRTSFHVLSISAFALSKTCFFSSSSLTFSR